MLRRATIALPAAALLAATVVIGAALAPSPVAAQTAAPAEAPAPAPAPSESAPAIGTESRGNEEPAATLVTPPPDQAAKKSRWHGSTLLLDQSTTTQTLHLGGDYQSANSTYELWLAFKPRFFLYESKTNALNLNLWANLYLELTDSDSTTRARELLLGPTYLSMSYAHTFIQGSDTKTVVSLGPRAVAPTDKAARGSGQLVGLGGSLSLSQHFPLRGSGASSFRTARLGGSATYNHPFWRATSPVNSDLQRLRQDVAGRTIVSDQLTGTMNVKDSLSVTASGDVQILPRWEVSLSYVWLTSWTYLPPGGVSIETPTGPVQPIEISDPTHRRMSTWATAAVNYDATDDFSVTLGYYNLASQLGADGTRRNPLWSPNARLFLTVTANLDSLYQRSRRR